MFNNVNLVGNQAGTNNKIAKKVYPECLRQANVIEFKQTQDEFIRKENIEERKVTVKKYNDLLKQAKACKISNDQEMPRISNDQEVERKAKPRISNDQEMPRISNNQEVERKAKPRISNDQEMPRISNNQEVERKAKPRISNDQEMPRISNNQEMPEKQTQPDQINNGQEAKKQYKPNNNQEVPQKKPVPENHGNTQEAKKAPKIIDIVAKIIKKVIH